MLKRVKTNRRVFMRQALVGSSIHGNLLSPNDTDIAIETDNEEQFISMVNLYNASVHTGQTDAGGRIATARNGNLNHIILLGISLDEYVGGMDVNLVRGYRIIPDGELVLKPEAKQGLENKTIEFLDRGSDMEKIFEDYSGRLSEDRHIKYASKIPKGFTLIIKG